MNEKSPENNETKIDNSIISTEGTPTSESPKGKEIVNNTKQKTKETKQETNTNFEEISKNPKLNENFKKVIEGLSLYIDTKLEQSGIKFSKIEKDNIKLALIDNFSEKVNNISDFSLGTKIIKTLNLLKTTISNKNEIKEEKSDSFKAFFDELQIEGLQNDINEKIKELVQTKKDKGKNTFLSLGKIFSSMNLEEKTKEEIQKDFEKTSEKFKDFSKIGENIQNTADKLGIGDTLKQLLDYIKKEFPILGAIISMFFGGKLEKNGNHKNEKSILNLKNFLEKNKEKSPLDKIEKKGDFKNKEKLNTKNLKTFYEYLNSIGIKYGNDKSEFWEEFLTGTNKDGNNINQKTEKLRQIFLKNLNGKRLEDLDLEEFINILNKIPNLAQKEEKKILDEKNGEIKKEIEKAKQSGDTQKVKELEKQIEYSFEDLLKQNKIEVKKGQIENISIINGGKNIKIGETTYDISIQYWGERFNRIEGSNGNYTIYANGPSGVISKPITPIQIKTILQDLVEDDNVNTNIQAGKYNVNLIIRKKA